MLRTARLRGWSSEEFAGPKLADIRPERAQLRGGFQRPQLWQMASGRTQASHRCSLSYSTTRSPWSVLFKRWPLSSVTVTMSSIRTPNLPAR
jgi:hypothetical protein